MWRPMKGLLFCSALAQNGRLLQPPSYYNGHGWDIRLAVPGEPGNDYPTLATIPRTSFSCAGKEPGYYADVDTNCQVFRVCTVGATYGFQSFLCPNGTLFNQAVFVCDWWMNVNCKKSDELRNKNDQFENLKLGPQLMKEVKKMLTHPVRNPFNTNTMRSKLLIMQNYKPPTGQLFPNGALLATPDRVPSHIYIPTKAIQIALRQNENNTPSQIFSASTLKPQHLSSTRSTSTTIRNIEILQRQRLNNQTTHNYYIPKRLTIHTEQIISNGHAGQMPSLIRTPHYMKYEQTTPQLQSYKNLLNIQEAQSFNAMKVIGNNNDQKSSQYREYNKKPTYNYKNDNSDKVSQVPLPAKLKYAIGSKQQPNAINKTQNEQKLIHNFVSNDIVPPTILTKTVAYSRLIQEPEQDQPKSRITFKTWVLKPSKSAKLVQTNSTSERYNKLFNFSEELTIETPYNYNKPTQSVIIENISETEAEEGYNYNKPTTPSETISSAEQDISRLYLFPKPSSAIINEALLTTTVRPTKASHLYIAPEPFNFSARQYLPPNEISSTLSNQYLVPNSPLRKLSRYQNSKLLTSPTSTTLYTTSSFKNNIELSHLNQHSTKNNNISFSDLLSKENLDITINEIVNDTNDYFVLRSPKTYNQHFNALVSNNNLSKHYVKNKELTENPINLNKPAKLIANPSLELQPPIETFHNNEDTNKLSELPFLTERVLPTIERTVSLKIAIPEAIANYLFKSQTDTELEILKTDSNNFMILKNNQNYSSHMTFSPIGKIILDENSNFSASQALVFSLLADSINTAKKYNNIIKENIMSPTLSHSEQFKTAENKESGHISKSAAQLTASKFTEDQFNSKNFNNYKGANPTSVYQRNNENIFKQYKETSKFPFQKINTHKNLIQKPASLHAQNNKLHSKDNRNMEDINKILQGNTNEQIYSGQLYQYTVPEVTKQIINSPNPANANIIIKSDLDQTKSHRIVIPKNSVTKAIDSSTEINSNVKLLNIQSKPFLNERLQLLSSTETPQLKTQDISNTFASNLFNVKNSITAQIQDKIVGTIPYSLDKNKFVTYKKDQSYYLYSNHDNGNFSERQPISKEILHNLYPDFITFHFIPTEIKKVDDTTMKIVSHNELQNYHLSERNYTSNDLTETFNNLLDDKTYTNNKERNINSPFTTKRGEAINTLYAGPSSYSAPQLSIGNLLSTQGHQSNNYNSKIEDFDESDNFDGYIQERPSREFTFK